MSAAVAGAPLLLRTSMRHEARSFAPWVAIATVLSASSVLVYPWVFPTEADRAGLATVVGSNPALGLIFGPAFDVSTADGFNAWRTLALGGLLTALGAIFVVTRATRGQEDSGQAELLASGVLGRSSRLLTAVAMGLVLSVIVGTVAALVTWACGGTPGATFLLCATYTATGWMATGVAAVTSQLGAEARAASSMAVGAFGVLFILRGFAYSVEAPEWTLWINPLAWMTETKPAFEDRWWPLLLAVALTAVALAVAFVLQARRDFGQGAIAPSPGPARGRARSVRALTLQLNRGSLIAWTLGFVVLGFVFGYFTTAITDLLEVRMGLECNAAALAATRAVDKDFKFMEKSIEEMQKEVASGRLGTEADAAFHMAIAYATQNPLQVFIMKNFYDFLFTGIKVNLEGLYQIPANIDTILEQHRQIYQAIRDHDPEAAYRAMKQHIDFVHQFYKRQGK